MIRTFLLPVLAALAAIPAPAQPYWTSLEGPDGGNVSYITRTAAGTYLALADNGVYRSTGGDEWRRAMGPQPTVSFLDATQTASGALVAGTANGGVWRSTDDGLTWSSVKVGLPQTHYDAVAASRRPSEVLAAGGAGVFISVDDGVSWSATDLTALTTSVVVDTAGFAYAAVDGGVRRSDPSDRTRWVWADSAMGDRAPRILAVADDGALWGATPAGGAIRSTDRGATWDSIVTPSCCLVSLRRGASGEMLATFAAGGAASTRDNGATWQPLTAAGNAHVIQTLFRAADTVLLAGTARGVYGLVGPPETPWYFASEGIVNSTIRSLIVTQDAQPALYVLQYNGLFAAGGSVAEKGVFDPLPNVTAFTSSMTQDSTGRLVIAFPRVGLLSSPDGVLWTPLPSDPASLSTYALASSRSALFAGQSTGSVSRSTDGGTSWTSIDLGLTTGSRTVNALAVAGDTVWAGTEQGLFRSIDAGLTYAPIGPALRCYSIALAPGGLVYIGSYVGRVYRSNDRGETWSYSSAIPTAPLIAAVAVNRRGHVFAGGQPGGVAVSTDGGVTWTQRNDGLTNPAITAIAFDSLDYAYVGTFGAGVFRSTERTAGVPRILEIARVVELLVSDGSVALRAQLDRPVDAQVDVYDLRGVRLASQSIGLEAGTSIVPINLPSAPGACIVRAIVGEQVISMLAIGTR